MNRAGYAVSVLGGDRQRYARFGWQNGGVRQVFDVTTRSLGALTAADRKLRLERDGLIVHAAGRTHAETKRVHLLESRFVLSFRDHFIHEPAAYALSEVLHLDMVPPAVPTASYAAT